MKINSQFKKKLKMIKYLKKGIFNMIKKQKEIQKYFKQVKFKKVKKFQKIFKKKFLKLMQFNIYKKHKKNNMKISALIHKKINFMIVFNKLLMIKISNNFQMEIKHLKIFNNQTLFNNYKSNKNLLIIPIQILQMKFMIIKKQNKLKKRRLPNQKNQKH